MDTFLNHLKDPVWWASAMIVGLIVGIIGSTVSHHLVRVLDAQLARASAAWRDRSAARKATWQAAVCKLRGNPAEQLHQEFVALRFFALFIGFAVVAFVSALLVVATERWFYAVSTGLSALGALATGSASLSLSAQIRAALDEDSTQRNLDEGSSP